jgi:ABC-type phosphate transport system substrate-binding protein
MKAYIMKKIVAVFLTTFLLTTALFAGGAKESNSSTQDAEPVDMMEKETVNLKVWGSIDAQDLLKEMVESFKQ